MRKSRKPKEIVRGRAYRMWSPFCARPSNLIALVTRIEQITKTTRNVHVEWTRDGDDWSADPRQTLFGYGEFLSRVHSEAPFVVN